VKAAEWDNPPNEGSQITAPKPAKNTAELSSAVCDLAAKTLMTLTVLATIEAWNQLVRLIKGIKLTFGLQQRN